MLLNKFFTKLFLFIYFISLGINTNAQTGIFFQAIARDNFTNPAKDRKIYVQTNIMQSSPTGTIVLIEQHETNTDAYGIFSIMVGNGERVGGTAAGLSTIDWSKGPYYLNINIAITPVGVGSIWDFTKEWVNLGTTIFGTVPFALYSANTARIDEKLNSTDTAKMLSVYAKAQAVQTLSTTLDTKLAIKDTAAMLAPYAKPIYKIDSSFLKLQLANKLDLSDTIKYAKQSYTDAALLTKMNNFDTSSYAKQFTVDAALLTKMNSFDISTYAKQVTVDAALLTKLSLTGNAVSATTAINAGTATSATKLTTARNINGVAFDGSAAITVTADAGTLTGAILKSTVTGSSLTSVGTIASLTTGAITNSGKLIVGASSAASASAVLEANSTTQGFLPPRMSYYQRTQIASPIAGLTIWCSNCGASGEMQVFNGGAWTNMIGGTATGTISLSIGDNYQGGKVAYILVSGDPGYDATTQHGLIAATTDQIGGIQWYNGSYTSTGATGTAIGTGFSNTNKIIASQGGTATSYAAGVARAYTGGGYADWYLPSKDELNKLFLSRSNIGGYVTDAYWSSSERNNINAWAQDFFQPTYIASVDKVYIYFNVRAIRSF